MRVLGQKTVTRMNRIHIRDFSRADDPVNAQVTFRRRRAADANGFIGHLHVHRVGIHFGINGHRPDIQFLAGANNPNGDFTAIGDQNFLKHGFSVKVKMLHGAFFKSDAL